MGPLMGGANEGDGPRFDDDANELKVNDRSDSDTTNRWAASTDLKEEDRTDSSGYINT